MADIMGYDYYGNYYNQVFEYHLADFVALFLSQLDADGENQEKPPGNSYDNGDREFRADYRNMDGAGEIP